MDWGKVFDFQFFDASPKERDEIENMNPSDLVKDLEKTIEEFDKFDWTKVSANDVFNYLSSMEEEMYEEWDYQFPVFTIPDPTVEHPRLQITPDWENITNIEDASLALYAHLLILRSHLPVALELAGLTVHMDSVDALWNSDPESGPDSE